MFMEMVRLKRNCAVLMISKFVNWQWNGRMEWKNGSAGTRIFHDQNNLDWPVVFRMDSHHFGVCAFRIINKEIDDCYWPMSG